LSYRPVNIIKKQIVEFDVSTNAPVLQLQEQLQDWCNRQLLPQLQQCLEPYASDPEVTYIDKLVIDIDHEMKEADEQLVQKIMDELLKQIPQHVAGNITSTAIKPSQKFAVLLKFYLEHGHLPWWSGITGRSEFEKQFHQWIVNDAEATQLAELKTILQQFATAKRLISIVPDADRWLLFEKLSDPVHIRHIRAALQQVENAVRAYSPSGFIHPALIAPLHEMMHDAVNAYLVQWIIDPKTGVQPFPLGRLLMRAMISAGYTEADVQNIFAEAKLEKNRSFDVTFDGGFTGAAEQALPLPPHFPENKTVPPENKLRLETEQEGIYISNAGLVLAAQYLPGFFERTGLRQDDQFVHPALAVSALQWMVNGSEEPAEFELVLPKILCGMLPNAHLPQVKEIPAFIKQEAIEMLESLIRHWSILQNTSVAALQASFLQRNGKLSRVKDHWLLQVEQKPYDMLLEHLPWTIGVIKLPFMREMLFVEWI
jgi:Contractile injection system tape measure protein